METDAASVPFFCDVFFGRYTRSSVAESMTSTHGIEFNGKGHPDI
jgi:hypothetical protein